MKTLGIYLRFLLDRTFYILFLLAILVGAYLYTFPQVEIKGYLLNNPLYLIINDILAGNLPDWMHGVRYITLIFIVASFLILFLIIYYKQVKLIKERVSTRYMNVFVNKMFHYLYAESEYSEEERNFRLKKLKKNLRSDYSKRLFIDTLRKIHVQTTGDVSEKAIQLFKMMKYDYLIRAYLHSPYLRHKIFALKAIADFRLQGYDDYIKKLTKRRNNVLRNEALYTLVTLSVYDNLLFLVDLNIKLTMWDINTIIKTLKQLKKQNVHYFPLINSRNPQLLVLGIMLARINNRKDFKPDIKSKIGNPSQLVSDEAFLSFISFADSQADYDFMIDKYELASDHVQCQIIKTLARSKDKAKTVEFLNWVVENKPHTQKIEAIRLLMELELKSITRFKNSDDKLIKQSCLQVLDINL